MLILSHPTGNANVRAAARAFHAVGWLRELHSCLCWDPGSPLAGMLPACLAGQFARRSFPGIPLALQHSHPWRELARLATPEWPLFKRHEHAPFSIDAVYRSFDHHVAGHLSGLLGLQAVYAYEDGALQTFQTAEYLGLSRFYDLPIGYWRAARLIFEEERELQPKWGSTLTGLRDSPAKLARKDAELQLADVVVVPSQFVRSTLLQHHACSAPIAVVPFGSPPVAAERPPQRTGGPLRVLFVGSLGQRKGLSYLFEAIDQLGSSVSLTLIGRPVSQDCRPLAAALEKHHWIPSLPHSAVLKQMRQHDVLVLPSLFEGYALVVSEALAQGLPVIATANSGAPESVRDGVEGFIVPIRSSQAIAGRLEQLATNPERLIAMGKACLHRAEELSWAHYENGLREVVAQAHSSGI